MRSSLLVSSFAAGLLLVGAGCSTTPRVVPNVPDQINTVPSSTAGTVKPTTGGTATKPATTATTKPAPKALTYAQALDLYRGKGLIQFNDCRATPGVIGVKKGAAFMLDNRDAKTHTIVADKKTYRLAPYSFVIVTASTVGSSYITCDGGGSGELKVQL